MPRRRSRFTYYRRRATVLLLPLLLVAGTVLVLRERGQRASADPPVHGQDDAAPIEVPTTVPAPTTTAPTPSTLEPDPIVPGQASHLVPSAPTSVWAAAVAAGPAIAVPVLGQAGVPGSGVSAVALGVTVTGAGGSGQVTVTATARAVPPSPTVDLAAAGDTGSGFVIVPVGADGAVALSSTVDATVSLDVEGWFLPSATGAADGRFVTVAPARILDTTLGTSPLDLPLLGDRAAAGLPPAGVEAVVLQLTARDGEPPGQVTAWPAGQPQPDATTVTVPAAGSTSSNLALVPLGTDGAVTVRSSGQTHLAVDVLAWVTDAANAVTTEGLFLPLPAARVVDTANGDGGPLDVRLRRDVTIGDRGGLPPFGAQAALGKVSAAGPADSGAVTLYPGGTARPDTPTLHVRGDGRPTTSSAWLRLGQRGTLSAWADARTDLVVDVAGYVIGHPVAPDPAVAPTAPSAAGAESWPEFDAVVDQFVRAYGVPAASVAVAKDGRVVYARAYGTADPISGVPARVDSRFRYASMSKVLTSAVVLQLVQAGQLSLDDHVFSVLARSVPLPPGADGRLDDITIRDLLDHTSGLAATPDVFFNRAGVAPQSCHEAAQWIATRGLAGIPGAGFSYVNMNFCLLSLVVEAVTGEPYLQALQERVLDERGVHDVGQGHSAALVPGEVAHANGAPWEPGVGWFMESLLGAGGLVGTPTDLVRVVDGLDPGRPGEHLLDPVTYLQMLTPGPGGWGLGVRLFGGGTFGHTGSLASSRGMVVHQADGVTWAITTNGSFGDHGSVLYGVMSRAIATVGAWPTWDLSPDLP
jgi:CubicO group peptidase (beta-lactamase class C family)